jgi:hypothetical protein
MIIPFPKRSAVPADEGDARRWRGALFEGFRSPLKWVHGGYYRMLETPKSVTFPICISCDHVIWNWPHFEEEVPDNAICDDCAEKEEQ